MTVWILRNGRIFRRQTAQSCEQGLRIMIDGPDAVILKHGGENALQNFAIGQHVGNAAGHAQIVFQDGEAAIGQTRTRSVPQMFT